MGIKLSGLISLHILMSWPVGMIGRTVKKGYSLRLAQKVLSSIPESLNGDYETVRSTLEK